MNPYIKLPDVPVLSGRQELILKKCEGKRVLHLGCVDSGLVYDRFERRELMHQKLSDVARDIWGVDIDAEGISFMSSKGFHNLIVGDISELDKIDLLQGKTFDVIVASEVIEHLQNPGLFLDSVRSLMIPEKTELIITIPNAFRIDTLIWLLRGIEYVHPDHNYWFSYYTATSLLKKNDFEINEVYVYSFQRLEILPSRIHRLFKKRKGVTNRRVAGKHRPISGSFLDLVFSYLRSFPKRLIVCFLYRRTPFWGDGIVFVTKTAENAD